MKIIQKYKNIPNIFDFEMEDQKQQSSQLYEYVDSVCKIYSSEHFLYCGCCHYEYQKVKTKMLETEQNIVRKLESVGEEGKRNRLLHVPEKAREIMFQHKQGKLCPVERDELLTTIKIFEGKYDLSDARVYSILKSLLDLQLTSFRMQRESTHSGVMIKSLDKYGNETKSVNPVEDIKRKYNETFIKAIEILNKIIEGEKHFNVNMELSPDKVFKRSELYKDD